MPKTKELSREKKKEKLRRAKQMVLDAVRADSTFQREAEEDFAFYSGHQWDYPTKKALEEQGRPALVFNVTKPVVDLILGVNEQNKVEVKADPVEPNDQFLTDVLNAIADKVKENYNIEIEQDEMFADAVTVGKGWIGIDIEPDPKRPDEIRFSVLNIPVHEVRVDAASRKDDRSDAAFIVWDKWVGREDFKIQYPKHANRIDELMEGRGIEEDFDIPSSREESDLFPIYGEDIDDSDYERELDIDYYDKYKNHIRIVHMEYWESYWRYYGFNPRTGQQEEFLEENLERLQAAIPAFDYVRIRDKKVKWLQFTGDDILFDGDSPLPFDGFSIVGCFAYKDKSNRGNNYYGVVRPIKDPQREVNKRWSQAINLLMEQGQGGEYAEIDAPMDLNQWNDSKNSPGATTWVSKGALTSGKIQAKEIPRFPDAPIRLEELSQEAIKRISGVNTDLLGIAAGRAEPGVVVRMRQQQGLTLLAKLFRNYKSAKKQFFERLLACIMAFMPDSQIQRILGSTDKYLFRGGLIVDKENGFIAPLRTLRDLKYNVTIREAPSNMNKSMYELSVFLEMLSKGFPVDPKVVVEKLDLSGAEKARWIQFIERGEQQQAQMAQAQLQSRNQEVQGKLQIQQGKLQLDAQKAQVDQKIKLLGVQSNTQVGMSEIQQRERDSARRNAVDIAKLDQKGQQLILELVERLMTQQYSEQEKGVA